MTHRNNSFIAKRHPLGARYSLLLALLGFVVSVDLFAAERAVLNEAATIITSGSPDSKIGWAHLVIDQFYRRLIEADPLMTMTKSEVIYVLNRAKINGIEDGACDQIMNGIIESDHLRKTLIKAIYSEGTCQ